MEILASQSELFNIRFSVFALLQPVPSLPPAGAGDMFVGQECYITGWGDTCKFLLVSHHSVSSLTG